MIDVTIENFETEVIAASMNLPVLVDFWAPWCGPCKSLGPILEKLETAYGGRFKLVKIDSDQQQELAGAFGIRSIPTCILMKSGQPVDGFMGALPESQVRAFLDKHVPADEVPDVPVESEPTQDPLTAEDLAATQARLAKSLAAAPDNDDLRHDYLRLLISSGQLAEAAATLAPAMARIPVPLRFEALAQWLNAMEFTANDPRGGWPLAKFDEKIEENRRDFETRFAKSRVLMARGEWTAAMDELLEIIMRDKKWDDEAPRRTYVAILEMLTPAKSRGNADATGKSAGGIELAGRSAVVEDPQATLVSSYRRKLSMALN